MPHATEADRRRGLTLVGTTLRRTALLASAVTCFGENSPVSTPREKKQEVAWRHRPRCRGSESAPAALKVRIMPLPGVNRAFSAGLPVARAVPWGFAARLV